jgi:hypothetical protein
MNLWIVTIGSSDIQLDSDRQNQQKQRGEKRRSDRVWQYWYVDEIKARCHDLGFEPKPLDSGIEELYRVPPRVLGMVYMSSIEETQAEIWGYLNFPLLDSFVKQLEQEAPPDAIVVLLTDQSAIFKNATQRPKLKSPYWQDTSTLQPILQRYFQEKFPDVACEWLVLTPTIAEEGLDNWNAVLRLVKEQLRTVQPPVPYETVYVSHQASTPAISSAIQFLSLAQFGERVRFLVSNEHNTQLTEFVESPSYLQELNREKAKELLDRHDYAGVKELIFPYSGDEIKSLLDAAIQWNFSEFEAFVKKLKEFRDSDFLEHIREDLDSSKEYWRTSYESAYLAVVRLRQGSTVEAMFHSFRAVEGLLRHWAESRYKNEIEYDNTRPFVRVNNQKYYLYGSQLYKLLKSDRTIDQVHDQDIWAFGETVFARRNDLFHQLKGLQEPEAVFTAWGVTCEVTWRKRVLECLNFISERSDFESLEQASLMAKVHAELERAIANSIP